MRLLVPWIARETSIIIADSENAKSIVDPIVIRNPKNIGRWYPNAIVIEPEFQTHQKNVTIFFDKPFELKFVCKDMAINDESSL